MSVPSPTVSVLPRVSPTSLEFWWSTPLPTVILAVGRNVNFSSCIAKSTDGLNWTDSSGGGGNNPFTGGFCMGVAWNGSYWVAVGSSGGSVTIAKSTDGLTWTDASNSSLTQVNAVAWNGSYWVAGGRNGNYTFSIAKSPDGLNWTDASDQPFTAGDGCSGVAWNGSYWIAVGGSSTNSDSVAKSTDGMTWTPATDNPFNAGGYGIAWNGSYWVAVGAKDRDNPTCIAKSTDGMTWTPSTDNPFLGNWGRGIAWNGSYWVAVGSNTGNTISIAKSPDGMTWTASTDNPFSGGNVGGRGIAWVGSYWIAVGKNADASVTIAKSTDGMTWTASTNNPFAGGIGYGIAGFTTSITGYRLQNASPSVTVTLGPVTNTTVTGLTTLTDYSFTIQTNIGGTYSSAVPFRTVRTSGRPDPVTNLATSQSVVNGELSLTFTWTDPVDYATYHVYGLRTGVNDSIYSDLTPDLAGTITFTGLDATRVYTFHIQRGNDAGYSTALSIATTATQVFNPAAVPGLQFWVDATDTAGNGSSVADGTTVATWVDKSGKSNNATSASGATLQTDSLGRYLDFSAKSYNLTASRWIYQQTYTIFVVDKPLNYTGPYTLVGTQAASSDSFNIRYENNGIVFSNYDDNQELGKPFASLTSPVNVWCFTNYGGKTAYWNKQVSGKYNSEDSSVVDSLLTIGAFNGSTNKYSGRLREILMFNGRLAEADREGVTDYLYNKWYPQTSQFPLVPVENGAILWLDAQDSKTFYTDTAGTVRGTTSIKFWKDKTGSGNDMIDASGGSLTTVNSQTAFTPVGLTQTATYLNFADATLFLVAQNTSGQGYFSHGVVGLSKTGSTVSWHESPTANNNQFTDLGSPFIFYGRMKKGQLLSGSFIDASGLQTAYTVEDLSLELGTATLKLNDVTTVKYGEVLYYNRVLSDAEVTANAAYLSAKWGIAIPSTAPFSPQAAPGLKVWLDSSDPYTVFKSGNTLTAWKDRSVNGNNAVPFGSPTVNNGVVFDGSQYLTLPDSALPQETYSYYIVANDLSNSTIVNAGSRNISGQMWVAVGSGVISTSLNGMTWTDVSNNPFAGGNVEGIAWNGSYWVAVGGNNDQTVCMAKSTDSIIWTSASNNPFETGSGRGIAWNGSYWVSVGFNGDFTVCVAKSPDGLTWTDSSNNPFSGNQGTAHGIEWNGSYWLAVGANNITDSTVCIAKSTDGMTWTDSSGDGGNNPFTGGSGLDIAWNGSYWIAVGANYGSGICIAKSQDGITWTNSSNNPFSGATGVGYGVAWNGSYWVAVGNNGDSTVTIAKSTDGMTWTNSSNNPFPGLSGNKIAWNGSYWVAVGCDVGFSVCIAKSQDGMTWTASTNNPFPSGGSGIATGIGPPHNSLVNIQTVGQYAQTTFNSDIKGLTWIAGGQGGEGGGTNPIAYSTDGEGWAPATSMNLSHVNGIASNGSYWVAVGYNDAYTVTIAKSTNGLTWTNASNNPFTGNMGRGIAWNGSYWVAVGRNTASTVTIAKSTDGMTWTNSSNNPFTGGSGRGIAWNGSYWVAVGNNTGSTVCIAKSPDGMTWTDSSGGGGNNPFNSAGNGIAWNGSYWVAVGANTGTIAKSPDGLNWTDASNSPFGIGEGNGIAWNGSYWVAVGRSDPGTVFIAKSTDGMTWANSDNTSFTQGAKAIGWNGSYWIAVGYNTSNTVSIAKSPDGLTWTDASDNPFTAGYGNAIAYGYRTTTPNTTTLVDTNVIPNKTGAGWLVVGAGNQISGDGVNWTASNNPFGSGFGYGVAWNGSYWVAVGNNSANTVSIAKSTNGINWTDASNNPFSGGVAQGIAWNGSYWLAVGQNIAPTGTVTIAKSTDGITWVDSSGGGGNNPFTSAYASAVAWNGSYWVAVGIGNITGASIAKSPDGLNWTDASNSPFSGGSGEGIAWNGSYWVAVGNNSANTVSIAKSTNGINWTDISGANNPFTGGQGKGIAWNGSYWVAVGSNSTSATPTVTIAKSPDGITWTQATDNAFATGLGYAVTWNGTYWIAVGEISSATTAQGLIAISTDGMLWTTHLSPTVTYGIAFGGSFTFPVSKTVIIESIYNGTGKRLYLSGKTGATDTSSPIQDASNNYIGWDMGSGYMKGTIKELLVYDTAHTTTQRKQVEQYLKAKWYPTTYTPADASGVLGLWLDSDPSTFKYAGTGIRTWRDKSGHADAKQDQLWAQPIYSVDPVTGKSGVQFGSDGMSTGLTVKPFTNTSSWTITAVQRYDYSSDQTTDLVNGLVSAAYDASGFKVGTTTTTTPNTLELALTAGTASKLVSAEIHTRPVMTSQIVTDLSSNAYVNGSNLAYQLVPGWIAGGNTAVTTSISTDGFIWTDVSNTVFSAGATQGIAWNGSYWIAVGFNGDYSVCIAKSVDGVTWTNSTNNPFTSATGSGLGIAWNGSYWIAVGNGGTINSIAKSLDGMIWTNSTNNPFADGVGRGIAWNGSYWIAVGIGSTGSIVKSLDGMTWTDASNNPFTAQGFGIAWNGSYWVAVGQNTGNTVSIAKSPDGMTWTDASNNPFTGGDGRGIAWNGSYWVAVGTNTDNTVCIAKSPDGMTWTDASNNPFTGSNGNGIAWNGSYWVAVGYNSDNTVAIAKSPDGMTWTDASNNPFSAVGGSGYAIAYGYVLAPTTAATTLTSAITSTTPLSIGYTGTLIPSIEGAMRGYIYELVVYNTALLQIDREKIEGYLAWKWGIQDLLATTHPYYLAPP